MTDVIVIHASHTENGGVVNATLFYAAALRAAGTSAEIWTASQGLAARAKDLSLPVFYHPWLKNAGLALIGPRLVFKAIAARKKAKAVVHQGDKLWLFSRLWLRGIEDGVVFHSTKINGRARFSRWLALSEKHKGELAAFAKDRDLRPHIRLIRNGALPDTCRQTARKPAARIEAIGCLSNFCHHKGVDVLIAAFARLIEDGHDLRLVLAGDGPERQPCEDLAKKLGVDSRIDWPGWVANPASFFATVDLFCLPSRSEPFGIVVTEAMQAGLAVIATQTDGPADIVVPEQTGWLIPTEDVTALYDALTDAIAAPEKTARYAAAGHARYREHYSLPVAGQMLADALVPTRTICIEPKSILQIS